MDCSKSFCGTRWYNKNVQSAEKILSGNILERVENYDEIAIITIYTGGKYNIENK
jgi:hypothetical protein